MNRFATETLRGGCSSMFHQSRMRIIKCRSRWLWQAIVLVAVLCAFTVTAVADPVPGNVFGPETFVRSKGEPKIETRRIYLAGFGGPYVLHLQNGDEQGKNLVSSGEVWLDGKLLIDDTQFSNNKNGKDIGVVLNNPSTLQVRIASKPESQLTIWIEGFQMPLVPPNPVLEQERAVTKDIIPTEGGVIFTRSSNGTEYLLGVPPNALLGTDPVSVTVTPITGIQNLPGGGTFVAGVRLQPEGILLYAPGKLFITVPEEINTSNLSGIVFTGSEGKYYTVPTMSVNTNNATFKFTIFHFSDWATYITQECGSSSLPQLTSNIYKSALSCAIQQGDESNQIAILSDWFDGYLFMELNSIYDFDSFVLGQNHYTEWLSIVYYLGFDDNLDQEIRQAETKLREKAIELVDSLDEACRGSANRCEEVNFAEKILNLQSIFSSWGFLMDLVQSAGEACGGDLGNIVTHFLMPTDLELVKGGSKGILVVPTTFFGPYPITSPEEFNFNVLNSNIASYSVFPNYDSFSVTVTGNDLGRTVLKVNEICGISGSTTIHVNLNPPEEPPQQPNLIIAPLYIWLNFGEAWPYPLELLNSEYQNPTCAYIIWFSSDSNIVELTNYYDNKATIRAKGLMGTATVFALCGTEQSTAATIHVGPTGQFTGTWVAGSDACVTGKGSGGTSIYNFKYLGDNRICFGRLCGCEGYITGHSWSCSQQYVDYPPYDQYGSLSQTATFEPDYNSFIADGTWSNGCTFHMHGIRIQE